MRENAVCRYCVFKNRKTKYILDFTRNCHNLLQKEEAGNIQTYIWDSEAVFLEENGKSYSYLSDMQGSAMRLLNHGEEDMISYRYDEFGTDPLGNQGQLQPFCYTEYQIDIVAGTYYAQARKYDAWSGRFTGEDVIKGKCRGDY
jgi:RHS repeat-associated protein